MNKLTRLNRYCCEDFSKIEGYKEAMADTSNTRYVCHHRLESTKTKEELIKLNLYYHRPASELIIMTQSEHMSLHHKNKKTSMKTREKMSKSLKGIHTGKHWYHRGNITTLAYVCPEGFSKGR